MKAERKLRKGSLNYLELIYYLKVSAAVKVLSAVCSRTVETCHAWIPTLLTLELLSGVGNHLALLL